MNQVPKNMTNISRLFQQPNFYEKPRFQTHTTREFQKIEVLMEIIASKCKKSTLNTTSQILLILDESLKDFIRLLYHTNKTK